jgi:hypothetical protein
MAALARKASLSDRSVQKIRNDVQGDWLTAPTANWRRDPAATIEIYLPPREYSSAVDGLPLAAQLMVD